MPLGAVWAQSYYCNLQTTQPLAQLAERVASLVQLMGANVYHAGASTVIRLTKFGHLRDDLVSGLTATGQLVKGLKFMQTHPVALPYMLLLSASATAGALPISLSPSDSQSLEGSSIS